MLSIQPLSVKTQRAMSITLLEYYLAKAGTQKMVSIISNGVSFVSILSITDAQIMCH